MKIKQDMFSLFGANRKYESLATILLPVLSFRNIHREVVLYLGTNCSEKLQIRYANLRV
ncbi:hypothetical protein [Flavobacterium zepuense]|uniref:hypothetical protein n=1 Tax=Flavobacterium zepuense TaxID=2593302 RepID=UPI00163D5655|nr:hypothetical protein [Flavobacterium zepuense]